MRQMMQRMMGGMLPSGIDPADLPEPHSPGARLLRRFCMQCHELPGPGLHTASEWPAVVDRMIWRMQMMGHGMMSGMMGIDAPSEAELRTIMAYLQKHAQKPLDPTKYPELEQPTGEAFRAVCSQCHALPDPEQHTAQEWPAVVTRMKRHMTATGKSVPDETTIQGIIAFLQQHSG